MRNCSCCSGSRFVAVMIGKKACKSIDSFLLEGSVTDLQRLHHRSHNFSPASGILPLSPLRLPVAELHQRCSHVRLLPRGRGMKLPDELRCLTLHSLHLKQRHQNRKPPFERASAMYTCSASWTAATMHALVAMVEGRKRSVCVGVWGAF